MRDLPGLIHGWSGPVTITVIGPFDHGGTVESFASASFSGAPFTLNGIELEVVQSNPPALPAQGDPDHPEFLWPTSLMARNLQVIMESGQKWTVYRPPSYLADGRVQVPLQKPNSRTIVSFNVPVDALVQPIWYLGYAIPAPEPVEPPVLIPTPPDPVIPPVPSPIGETPVVPVQPPVDPTP